MTYRPKKGVTPKSGDAFDAIMDDPYLTEEGKKVELRRLLEAKTFQPPLLEKIKEQRHAIQQHGGVITDLDFVEDCCRKPLKLCCMCSGYCCFIIFICIVGLGLMFLVGAIITRFK